MGPLAGVRILEFDGLGPVTFAGMMLADMGAEVLRLTRGGAAGSSVFEEVGGAVLHRGRAAVPVDLKSPEDRGAVLDLIGTADGLIEGFRPGVMERLGLGPDVCAARNPKLVYGRVTGWGQDGPLASEVGHDINYLALSGTLSLLGEPDRPPRAPLNLAADYGGGALPLVVGMLAGIIAARTTGRGQVVDAAMTDGAALTAGLFHALSAKGLWTSRRGENLLDGGAPFYRCYGCGDGKFVAVGALEPRFYAALLGGLDIPAEEAPQYDVGQWKEITGRFAARFAERERDAWAQHFQATEACVTPVLSLEEAAAHPHNLARDTFPNGLPGFAPRFGIVSGPAQAGPTNPPVSVAAAAWTSTRLTPHDPA